MIIGAKVKDRNGEVIGQIDYLIRDTWSREIKKYMVRREAPNKDIFFSPDDALPMSQEDFNKWQELQQLKKRIDEFREKEDCYARGNRDREKKIQDATRC